jgi:hypothetical protein
LAACALRVVCAILVVSLWLACAVLFAITLAQPDLHSWHIYCQSSSSLLIICRPWFQAGLRVPKWATSPVASHTTQLLFVVVFMVAGSRGPKLATASLLHTCCQHSSPADHGCMFYCAQEA